MGVASPAGKHVKWELEDDDGEVTGVAKIEDEFCYNCDKPRQYFSVESYPCVGEMLCTSLESSRAGAECEKPLPT